MKEKSDDARLEALDVVRDAIRKIYDAKRDGTATAKDAVRLKELHELVSIVSNGKSRTPIDLLVEISLLRQYSRIYVRCCFSPCGF